MDAVLLDANVFYSAPIRDIFIELATQRLRPIRWTESIQDEWISTLRKNRPDLDHRKFERVRKLMEAETENALIYNYEYLMNRIALPDPNDRHVLAAAIVGNCKIIVTQNLRDFPEDILLPYGIVAQSPDEYLLHQCQLQPDEFCAVLRTIKHRLTRPSYSVPTYLANLTRSGLTETAAELQQHAHLLD